MRTRNKQAQIWVETVIYTLIGLAIIGLVLGLAKPKIDEMKDKAIIEQSIEMLNSIDSVIGEIKYVAGNSRPIEIKIQKGELRINGVDGLDAEGRRTGNYMEYYLAESRYKYSEPGQEAEIGKIKILTEEKTKGYNLTLKLDYSISANITFENEDVEKIIQASPKPVNIVVSNKGFTPEGIPTIDFS